jgi:hypothetical protein
MALEHDRIAEPTWARMTALAGSRSGIEIALSATINQVVPGLRAEDGFLGFLVLKSAGGQRAVVLTFWQSASAAAGAGVARFRDRVDALGVTITDVKYVELVAQEGARSA